jgi:hypothetical protein
VSNWFPVNILVIGALVLGACNSDTKPSTAGSASRTPGSAASRTSTVDCPSLIAASQELFSIQLMAQIKDPGSISRDSPMHVDTTKMLAALHTLHQLDGTTTPLGSAKDAIDFYEHATNELAKLLAKDAPTQADIDAYNQAIAIDRADFQGSVSRFLSKQAAIASALGEAGCRGH